ncbi:MAG: hypothetical protein RLZZ116_2382 [Planctomycetota bacterium]|jgi:hypothetical protein
MSSDADRAADDPRRDFFVGYLPLPARDAGFLRWFLPLLAASLVGVSLVMSGFQRDPGDGSWDTGHEVTISGELVAAPFPMLRLGGSTGSTERVLLVEMGKHGADARLAAIVRGDGERVGVQARGFVIERDGQRMLELSEGEAITVGGAVPPAAETTRLGMMVLDGEIVDSKCWLGVMKPGDGKAHRDCATLCIRGGIPPSIVCRAEDGSLRRALVVGHDGRPLPFEALAPWIARPVRLRGEVDVVDGLAIIRATEIGGIP